MPQFPHLQHREKKNINLTESHGAGGGGLVAKSCLTLVTPWTVARQDPLSMDFPGRTTAMSCHFLLQGIFPTQGSNSVSCISRQILYH